MLCRQKISSEERCAVLHYGAGACRLQLLPQQDSHLAKTPNFKQEKKRREEMQRKRNEEKQRQNAARKQNAPKPQSP